jgi:ribosomal-protein-alanine N-acetyltransferase
VRAKSKTLKTKQLKLKTQRLVLRPFQAGDVDDVYAYAFHPEWGQYILASTKRYTHDDAGRFVSHAILQDRMQYPIFAIVIDGHVVGSVGLHVNATHGIADLRFALGKSYWGQGLITEATTALVDWGFNTLAIEKITAATDARNVSGIRIMEKLGMTQEVLWLRNRINQGNRVDEVHYGILRSEWESTTEAPT